MSSLADISVWDLQNTGAAAWAAGAIVRAAVGNNQARVAQADSDANVAGVVALARTAVPVGSVGSVATGGVADVLLETGLTPAPGQLIYVSATVAGRGTNVAPAIESVVGTVIDTSKYATLRLVRIVIHARRSAGNGVALLKFSGNITGGGPKPIELYDVGATPGTTFYTNGSTSPRYPLPSARTARRLFVRWDGNDFATPMVLTILRNGVATGITVTIPASTATGAVSDIVNTAAFAAGELLSLSITWTGTPASVNSIGAMLELV